MFPRVCKGYTVYQEPMDNSKLIFITPHSGPALETPISRDETSDTIGSLCWRKMGGKLIISNLSRKRSWGIDFNREAPPLEIAKKLYKSFIEDKDSNELCKYRKKYAWVAKDDMDYYNRLKIYQNFWEEVKNKEFIILLHRAFPKIKSAPSVLDISLIGKEISKTRIKEIVQKINTKYYEFFKKIEKDYKRTVLLEAERTVLTIAKVFEDFDLKEIPAEFGENLKKDLEVIKEYADKEMYKELKEKFTPHNFIRAVDNALKKIPIPEVTIDHVAKGLLSYGPKNKIFPKHGKIIIEVEINSFMGFWHTKHTVNIIKDVLKELGWKA